MRIKPTISLFCLTFFSTAVAGETEPLMLANFDDPPHAMFGTVVTPGPSAISDGEAATFTNEGFRPVWKIVMPRGEVGKILESTPVLAMDVRSETRADEVKFIKLHLVLQTDVTGEDLFEPLEGVGSNPLRESEFRTDLSQARTENIASVLEAAKEFDAGKGGRFVFFLIQQSPQGSPNTVSYDNIRLEPR